MLFFFFPPEDLKTKTLNFWYKHINVRKVLSHILFTLLISASVIFYLYIFLLSQLCTLEDICFILSVLSSYFGTKRNI